MPPPGRRARRRRLAFRGRFFATYSARLGLHLRALEAALLRSLPELFDGTVAGRLAPHHDPLAGPGVSVAPGCSLPRGAVVGLYFGEVVDSASPPLGDHVLGLGRVRRGGRTFHINIDGARARPRPGGTEPDLTNAARFNHTCTGDTVRLARLASCPFPCAVAYTTRRLEAGEPLRWNYDGARASGGFTVDAAEAEQLQARGLTCVPCVCRGGGPCPRRRWFPLHPDA